eukprot:TRINITY_DN7208_c2_g1_i3.p1 TRINITY_DN7208_c2_g1~~TRINITY_DN7208_c2_g1_i3.p1  ORF type:complete len:186 (+),score=-3.08 TRINITY_DN7208_c2_g1_i3:1061-1618(+)
MTIICNFANLQFQLEHRRKNQYWIPTIILAGNMQRNAASNQRKKIPSFLLNLIRVFLNIFYFYWEIFHFNIVLQFKIKIRLKKIQIKFKILAKDSDNYVIIVFTRLLSNKFKILVSFSFLDFVFQIQWQLWDEKKNASQVARFCWVPDLEKDWLQLILQVGNYSNCTVENLVCLLEFLQFSYLLY